MSGTNTARIARIYTHLWSWLLELGLSHDPVFPLSIQEHMHPAVKLNIARFSPVTIALASLSTTSALARTTRFVPSSSHNTTRVRTMSTAAAAPNSYAIPIPSPPPTTFARSPIPKNPLGEGKFVRTAAALIIGYTRTLQFCKTRSLVSK